MAIFMVERPVRLCGRVLRRRVRLLGLLLLCTSCLLRITNRVSCSMSHKRESLLELAMNSSSSDDDEELLIGASQIMYNHYRTMNMPKHGDSVLGHRVVHRESLYNDA
jgi:hypothetical protein